MGVVSNVCAEMFGVFDFIYSIDRVFNSNEILSAIENRILILGHVTIGVLIIVLANRPIESRAYSCRRLRDAVQKETS